MPVAVDEGRQLPESATARARYISELNVREGDGGSWEERALLRAVAAYDVSWRVRAAAARHEGLPIGTLRMLAADRCHRVRRAALGSLAERGDEQLAHIVAAEPHAGAACAGVTPAVAGRLLEHSDAAVRAAAARAASCGDVRALLADGDAEVRAVVRRRLLDAEVPLGVGEVRRFVRDAALIALCAAACDSVRSYGAALRAVEDACDGDLVRAFVRRHMRFARAFDLTRPVEDRVVVWALKGIDADLDW